MVIRSGKPNVFCAGANIGALARASHAAQGQFLQIHQRDAPGDRGCLGTFRPALSGGGRRHRGRRRLRTGAGLRPDHADRRPPLGGVAAGSAAARRAARHWRPDAAHRQAPGAARPRRPVLRDRRRAARARARSIGAWSTRSCRLRPGTKRCASAPWALAGEPPTRPRGCARRASRCRRSSASSAMIAIAYRHVRVALDRARPAAPTITVLGAGAACRPISPASMPRAPLSGRWRWRANWTMRSSICASTSPELGIIVFRSEGDPRSGAGGRRAARIACRRLVRARNPAAL